MIDDCKAGNIDMIITKSISRFARNTLDCLRYIRQLKEKNIPVESHIFDKGDHGLSLANKVSMDKNKWGIEESVQVWTDYLEKWLDVWRNE